MMIFQVYIRSLEPSERYYLPQETGNYSVAGFRVEMERKVSHYIITYYIPSGLFVVVSWASFLIPCDDIQGRMALLVTLFLVLVKSCLCKKTFWIQWIRNSLVKVNIFNAITTNSPKADGLNALQVMVQSNGAFRGESKLASVKGSTNTDSVLSTLPGMDYHVHLFRVWCPLGILDNPSPSQDLLHPEGDQRADRGGSNGVYGQQLGPGQCQRRQSHEEEPDGGKVRSNLSGAFPIAVPTIHRGILPHYASCLAQDLDGGYEFT